MRQRSLGRIRKEVVHGLLIVQSVFSLCAISLIPAISRSITGRSAEPHSKIVFQQFEIDPSEVMSAQSSSLGQSSSDHSKTRKGRKRRPKVSADPFQVVQKQLLSKLSDENEARPFSESDLDSHEAEQGLDATESLESTAEPPNPRRKPSWVGTKEKRPRQKLSAKDRVLAVIQSVGLWTDQDYRSLATVGIEPLRVLSESAVLARASAQSLQVLAKSSPRVRAISPYLPVWKFSKNLGPASVFSQSKTETVDVFPAKESDLKDIKRIVIAAQGRMKGVRYIENATRWDESTGHLSGVVRASVPTAHLIALAGELKLAEYIDRAPDADRALAAEQVARNVGLNQAAADPAFVDPNFERVGFEVIESNGPNPGEDHVYPLQVSAPGIYRARLKFNAPQVGLSLSNEEARRLRQLLSGALDVEINATKTLEKRVSVAPTGEVYIDLKVALKAGKQQIRVGGEFMPLGPIKYSLVLSPEKT